MHPRIGLAVVGLSGIGYPLTQLAIGRLGRRGALLAEGVSAGLLVRDATMVAAGVPGMLRPVPAVLLRLEVVAAASATILGLRPALGRTEAATCGWRAADPLELARRIAVGALFGIHTWRFRIDLEPGQGLRDPDR